MNGLFNEATYFNAVPESVAEMLKHLDEWGGPSTYPHMAAGWAVALDTPFTWTKQVASTFGGTRNGMVIHWPKGIQAKGELRTQFSHVTDIAPTVLEAAGLPFPKSVDGTEQTPFAGESLAYTFEDAKAKTRHPTQYFEILGNRGMYHDGWLAGTVHRAPWEYVPRRPLKDDIWELYDTTNDFSLTNNLAAQNPAKLKELQELFMREGAKYHVLPIDDRTMERFDPVLAGRPDLMGKRTELTVYEGMTGMMENAFINIKNRSNTVTAEVDVPQGGADGVILCQGGRFGGWALYLKDGKPTYTYNWVGLQKYTVASTQALPAGKVTLRYEFAYDGGKPGSGGMGAIFVNGKKVAEARIEHTNAAMFSADDAADVGVDEGTPVADYSHNRFTGTIEKVTISVSEAKLGAQEKEQLKHTNEAAARARE
jgi:arylsulfatase